MKNISFIQKILYCITLCLALIGIFIHSTFTKPDFTFLIPNKIDKLSIKQTPQFSSELIPQPANLLSAHSATLTVLDNGDILALWFAGSHEGKPDVQIWQSLYHNGTWSMARAVISPELIQHKLGIYVRKVGNPVVYRSLDGTLHLFVVSVALGGWSGSHLNHFISTDSGNNWKFVDRLVLSPLMNFSTLVRTNPVTLKDGGFYLPVYNEFVRTYPELLYFDKTGKFIRQIRLSNNNLLLQPSIVPTSQNTAIAFLRNKAKIDDILYIEKTFDGGLSWTKPIATNLLNHDSSLVVTNLHNGLFLMVHDVFNRDKLALATSHDGIKWVDVYNLENEKGAEFSYPAIAYNSSVIDVLYTWKRKQIKHVRFNLSWILEQIKS